MVAGGQAGRGRGWKTAGRPFSGPPAGRLAFRPSRGLGDCGSTANETHKKLEEKLSFSSVLGQVFREFFVQGSFSSSFSCLFICSESAKQEICFRQF